MRSLPTQFAGWIVALALGPLPFGCAPGDGESPGSVEPSSAPGSVSAAPSGSGGDGGSSPARAARVGRRGRWTPAPPRPASGLPVEAQDEDEERTVEFLELLGYATGSRPPPEGATGVTVHDRERTGPGYNLVVSGHAPEAILMDMEGEEVHRWMMEPARVWRGRKGAQRPIIQAFRRAHLLPDGALLAIYEGFGLVKLERDNRIAWAYDGLAHHDLDVLSDGRILVLERELRLVPRLDPDEPVFDDYVTELDGDGSVLRRTSILDALAATGLEDDFRHRFLAGTRRIDRDLFHTNTLQAIDGERAGWSGLVDEGDVIVSMRSLDLLAVLDRESATFPWTLQGRWRGQHQPELLPDGRMLLFDNKGHELRSSILELDPQTGEIHWSVMGAGPHDFYSATCGSVQRLANGNTLVTESDAGRAFEVTRNQEIVWEYRSPHRAGDDGELVATLFDVVRFDPSAIQAWLGN